jgi:hypothetical protein
VERLGQFQTDGGFVATGTFLSGTPPAAGAGVRLMWAPAKAAIRAGRVTTAQWDDASIGTESAAFNRNTVAIGAASFAVNDGTRASGAASVAFGTGAVASGGYSVARGEFGGSSGVASFSTGLSALADGMAAVAGGAGTANAPESVAIGDLFTRTTGEQSVAFGSSSAAGARGFSVGVSSALGTASVALASASASGDGAIGLGDVFTAGPGSVAIGKHTTTGTIAGGRFYFGDRSRTSPPAVGGFGNQFYVRAAGGVGFYTNAGTSTGVELAIGGGSWAALSDERAKNRFRNMSGDEVLRRLALLPVRQWNYVTQHASIRHLGPTAQDFRAAFGLGDFPLRINTVDADGVALAAARALEAKTRDLNERHADLADEHRRLLARHDALVREARALVERLQRLEVSQERR